jgi:16S rRNA (cytosine1402-N4)-methyltransferase
MTDIPSSASSEASHEPVMLAECLAALAPAPGESVLDATLGLGGHAVMMLERVGSSGRLVGLDRDPEALRRAEARLQAACAEWGWPSCPVTTCHTDFRDLGKALDEAGIAPIHAALFDLGVSSMQLDLAERGFSFRSAGPLDMRMDSTARTTAAEVVNTRSQVELERILWEWGEERHARRIARALVAARDREPLTTTTELEAVVWGAYPREQRHSRLHPATRTFQALRIAVNDELAALEPALEAVAARLAPGGRVAVLSYHSLEDRLVKQAFDRLSGRCVCPPELMGCVCHATAVLELPNRKPARPSEEEIERNPRARSARLRTAVRLPV